jgi:hypothetical protein
VRAMMSNEDDTLNDVRVRVESRSASTSFGARHKSLHHCTLASGNFLAMFVIPEIVDNGRVKMIVTS